MYPQEKSLSRRQFVKWVVASGSLVAAAPAAAPPARAAAKPKLTVWTQSSFTKQADAAIKGLFESYGKENNVDVDFQIMAYNTLIEKLPAALEAGTPPDISFLFDADTAYYRGKGSLLDVTDVVEPLTKLGGGMFDAAIMTVKHKGRYWSVPTVMNPWPIHARQDLLDAAGIKQFPKTWVELGEVAKKLQKPPQLFGYGMAVGRSGGDFEDNFMPVLWEMGGKMENEDGTLDFQVGPVAKTLALMKKWYKEDKIIPPGAINWDDTGNNKAFQSEQAVFIHNPASVMSWLLQEKPELAKRTQLYPSPGRNVVDTWCFGVFKQTKVPAEAKACLAYTMQPGRYEQFIKALTGRWLPVYKDIAKDPLWNTGVYAEYNRLAQTGQLISYAGPPHAGFGEATNTYVLPDMGARVLVENWEPEKAAEEARKKLVAIWAKYKD
jgi:multiple sugar transport system substrate-binding protein